MSGDDNPKKKNVKLLSIVILSAAFIVLVIIVATLIIGNISGLFSQRAPAITVNEFNFDIGRDRVFVHMDGSIAAAGTLGVQVLDAGGRELLRDPFRMSQPALVSNNGRSVAFDIGGTAVRVFDSAQVLASVEAEGSVISASINQNGWFCIVTQEGGGIRGIVTVYNNTGAKVWEVRMRSGFVLSAILSPNNKNLAILNMIDSGSRITFYHDIDTEDEPYDHFNLPGGLIIDIKYLSNDDILAISTDYIFLVDSSGESKSIYPYTDNRLGSYTQHDDFIVLHLYDYGIGFRGRLVTLLTDGTVLGEMAIEREIISMSAVGKSIIILKNDSIAFYSNELEDFPASLDNLSVAGANQVLMLNEDTALATSDNSAVVIRRQEER